MTKPPTTIEFIRVERDCPANKRIRAEWTHSKDPAKTPRGLIYDWNVRINGEVRAVFKSMSLAPPCRFRGYELRDPAGRPIVHARDAARNAFHEQNGYPATSQAQFLQIVQILMDRIPTLSCLQDMRFDDKQTFEHERAGAISALRGHWLISGADKAIAILRDLVDTADPVGRSFSRIPRVITARAVEFFNSVEPPADAIAHAIDSHRYTPAGYRGKRFTAEDAAADNPATDQESKP